MTVGSDFPTAEVSCFRVITQEFSSAATLFVVVLQDFANGTQRLIKISQTLLTAN